MDERSVSRAATRLGLKQPTVSRMLGKLRNYFRDPLMLWAGGHMVPTPRALQLEGDVLQLIAMMERIASPAQPFDPSSSEITFKLVATGPLENIFLAKVMSAIAARAPAVCVEIRPPNRFQDTGAVEKGQIDFMVGWNLMAAPTLRSRLLYTDKIVCIARADHPDIGESLSYEKYLELAQVQFDIPGRTTTGQLLQERLARAGRQLNIRFRVQNHLTVADVVANSNMIATLSHRYARSFLTQFPLKILELPIRLPPIQNRIFWHERMQSDLASRWFRQLAADVAKKM
jgi:DNA-binding transcriptional LysR family regulator